VTEFDRRDLLKLGAAAFAASFGVGHPLVARLIAQGAPSAGATFFSKDEFALVDELSEIIIPTDAHSPGAKAAKVAAFIDGQLAEAWDEKDRTDWRSGLQLVDRLSQQANGKPFMQSSPDQRVAVLTAMAQNEANPQKPEEQFFAELKSRVVFAYYTSEIGIKQEMEYKGNTYLNEFVGTDVSKPNS
jgi:hypothetical protein